MTFIGGLLDHINDLNWFGALDKSIVWLIKWRIGGWMDGWMDGRTHGSTAGLLAPRFASAD